MKNKKKIIPLLVSITLLSGPVLLLTACDSERDMSNLPNGKINDDYKNRVLFDFLGVNFTKNVGEQFKDTYASGLDLILKDVEGIIAKQKFYEFFHNTLHYSEDKVAVDGTTIPGQANLAFEKLKDDLGLSLLTQAYLKGLNTSESLDKISEQEKDGLLFQNQSWHQSGTSKFNYSDVAFYKEIDAGTHEKNDPDVIFTKANLYKDHGGFDKDKAFDAQLAKIAKHPDENYSTDISELLPTNAKTWNGSAGLNSSQQSLSSSIDIPTYHKYLKRFQWWLRFRYQQYYQSQILPELNKTLFTMSWILSDLFNIKDEAGTPNIETKTNSNYISQLQDTNNFKSSNYRTTWDFTTSLNNAKTFNSALNSTLPKWNSIVSDNGGKKTLNTDFFNQLHTGTSPSFSNIDANFGINGFNSNLTNAINQVKAAISAKWVIISDSNYFYIPDDRHGTFTYTTPIYFLNVIQNLDFSYLMNDGSGKDWIPKNTNLIQKWKSSGNESIDTNFSKYIVGGPTSDIGQQQKWNIFWQMLYFISDSATNKETADANFSIAANNLFKTYIPQSNIYEEGFWQKIKDYY